MKITNQIQNPNNLDVTYRGLYKAGAAAALVAALIFRRNLDAEWALLRGTGLIDTGPLVQPGTVLDWFTLLQDHQLLGLTLLNLFDLVNYALVGLIFTALFAALRRTSPSWMVLAAVLGFAGVTVYFASNQALTMLSLSSQYTAETTDAQRALYLAAGQAVLAIHLNAGYAGSGIYLSFLLVSAAGLIISTVMLGSNLFSKVTASMGILANGFGLGYYVVLALVPELVYVPLSVSAVFLLVWYLLVARRLFQLGQTARFSLTRQVRGLYDSGSRSLELMEGRSFENE